MGLEVPVNVEITLMYFNGSRVADKKHVKAATQYFPTSRANRLLILSYLPYYACSTFIYVLRLTDYVTASINWHLAFQLCSGPLV